MLTDEQLRQIMPGCPKALRDIKLSILNETMVEFDITNELRAAAFLATLAVESAQFKYTEEIASGAAYEGRKDLGNVVKGDGIKYKGHGNIQLTGRDVHRVAGDFFGVDLITNPRLLTMEPLATRSAGWFWKYYKSKMNELADQRKFLALSIKINGRNKNGFPNGWEERVGFYERALRVLPDDFNVKGVRIEVVDASHPDYIDVELPAAPLVEVPKSTPEEKAIVTNIPAIPPLPAHVPGWATRFVTWGAGINFAGLGTALIFLKDNPGALSVVVVVFKWMALGLSVVGLAIVCGVFATKMFNAKLANDLNKERLKNFADPNAKNIDFSGWKGLPTGEEPKT